MKNTLKIIASIFIIIMLNSCFSFQAQISKNVKQTNDQYTNLWKQVDSLKALYLPKSADSVVDQILKDAEVDANSVHWVKAIGYKVDNMAVLNDEGEKKAIYYTEKMIEKSWSPARSILKIMLAKQYQWYVTNRMFKINSNTPTGALSSDIDEWSLVNYTEVINDLYFEGLVEEKLKQTPISDFALLLINHPYDKHYRKTLYDVLAHEAIDYFIDFPFQITKPSDEYYLDDHRLFLPSNEFVKIKFSANDSTDAQLKTLLLIQDLLKFHAKNNDKNELLDIDIKRLRWLHKKSIVTDKSKLYFDALNLLKERYKDEIPVVEIDYYLAEYYLNQSKNCERSVVDCPDRWSLVKARKMLQNIMNTAIIQQDKWKKLKEKSEMLLSNILNSSVKIQIEKAQLPNQNILALIQYTNTTELNFELRKLSSIELFKLIDYNYKRDSLDILLKGNKAFKVWNESLLDLKDHFIHALYLKIDPVPMGIYLLSWQGKEGKKWNHTIFQASNLASWEHNLGSKSKYIVVVNRKDGHPINDVKVTSFRYNNKYHNRSREIEIIGNAYTNKQGIVFPKMEKNGYANLILSKGIDSYYELNGIYQPQIPRKSRSFDQTHFFLDRKIYRPGQIIYFKGISVHFKNGKLPELNLNKKLTVTLRDVNYKVVKELELRSNEWGSFSGQFIAPPDRLLGHMSITSTLGSNRQTFVVEEYKRPKFYVTLEEIKEAYAIGDSLTLNGRVETYAGAFLDDVKIEYTISRYRQTPRWCNWNYDYFPRENTPQKIISRGFIKSDVEGRFKIPVYLEKAVESSSNNWYKYHVQMAVIDKNGERIDHQKSIYALEQRMFLQAPISQSMSRNDLKELKLVAKNMNGEPVKAIIKYQLMALKKPSKGLLMTSYLNGTVDTSIYPRNEFYSFFPDGVYREDHLPKTWPIKNIVEEGQVLSNQTIDLSKLTAGVVYKLLLQSKDEKGEISVKAYFFEVKDFNMGHFPVLAYQWLDMDKLPYEVDDHAQIQMRLKAAPEYVFRFIVRDSNNKGEWRNDQGQTNDITLHNGDRGNVSIQWVAMKNNRFYQVRTPVLLGWENKDLNIKLLTFRDKLLPGQNETWKVKISDSNNEIIGSELLASMYDQSLDNFSDNQWSKMNLWSRKPLLSRFNHLGGGLATLFDYHTVSHLSFHFEREWKNYPKIMFSFFSNKRIYQRGKMTENAVMFDADNAPDEIFKFNAKVNIEEVPDEEIMDYSHDVNSSQDIRSDLAETVFFYPHLESNSDGEVSFSFKMKEALTKWRLQLFAHTKDLKMGMTSRSLVTQKELMVVPSTPRILRVDDEVWVTAKVINMTDKKQVGKISFNWFDPSNNTDISHRLMEDPAEKTFEVEALKSQVYRWKIKIEDDIGSLVKYKVMVVGENHTDGEENLLPVLQNKIVMTSSMLMQVPPESTRTFTFNRYINAMEDQEGHRLTLQYLSHPIWLAIQALPYLNNPSNEGTGAIVDQLFANALSRQIAYQNPRIEAVFDQWRKLDAGALVSQLKKNEALKTVLLKETPWVIEGENETAQKKKIALLFDVNTMAQNLSRSMYKLKDRQRVDGGFGWFPGANRSSWYITLVVIEKLSLLESLGVKFGSIEIKSMMQKAITYLDIEMKDQYVRTFHDVKDNKEKVQAIHLDPAMIKYLYVRSFHPDQPIPQNVKESYNYYLEQMRQYWGKFSFYLQAMAGSIFHKMNEFKDRDRIIASLKEHAHFKESLGRYWGSNGYRWYQSDVETHTKIMGLMRMVKTDSEYLDEMRLWLLKNKSANHWKSSNATVNALFEIVQENDAVIEEVVNVKIQVGDDLVSFQPNTREELGTGLIQQSWKGNELTKDRGHVRIENTSNSTNWGAMYWQYFTPLDHAQSDNKLPIKIEKKLFKRVKIDIGDQLVPIDQNSINPGDEIMVRLKIVIDRELSYLHLKDLRPSGMEPIDHLSGYKWKGGTSFYKAISDEAAHYYFERLSPGTYVFENSLYVVHSGDFSVGPAIIESIYAPEYRAHSKGHRIVIRQ